MNSKDWVSDKLTIAGCGGRAHSLKQDLAYDHASSRVTFVCSARPGDKLTVLMWCATCASRVLWIFLICLIILSLRLEELLHISHE